MKHKSPLGKKKQSQPNKSPAGMPDPLMTLDMKKMSENMIKLQDGRNEDGFGKNSKRRGLRSASEKN